MGWSDWWFSSATARLAGRNRLAVSHRRGTVQLITTLPRTVDPRVPPLNSIVLDQRQGQKVGPCLGKTTSGTCQRPSKDTLLSEHSCVRPSVSTCNNRWPVSCGYAYALSGEVLGHRGNVAKLKVVALQQHIADARSVDGRLGKIKDRGGWWVDRLQNDCRTSRCLPDFPGTSAPGPEAIA